MERAGRAGAARATLIDMDGLLESQPLRTGRIAAARNRLLREIEQDPILSGFDYLAMLDMDLPNSVPLAAAPLMEAVKFLEAHDDVAGVFPNQLPFYYDIWTLRVKDWCSGDCWAEVRQAGGGEEAIAKFVHARQIYLDPARDPIEVESAFGGIGLYRLNKVLGHSYEGFAPDGAEVSDHVGLHHSIRQAGGRFFILPAFLNFSSFEHTNLLQSHTMVTVDAASLLLTLQGAAKRAQFPRFGEAFAGMAALYSGTLLDLAPEGGANLVQARRRGFSGAAILAEQGEREFAVLSGNALIQRETFGPHRLVHGALSALAETAREAGLVRFGTGNDASAMREALPDLGHHPILWARMETPDEAAEWEKTLALLPYDLMLVFNSLGAKIIAGPLESQKEKLLGLMRRLPQSGGGLDLAFFAEKDRAIYTALGGT